MGGVLLRRVLGAVPQAQGQAQNRCLKKQPHPAARIQAPEPSCGPGGAGRAVLRQRQVSAPLHWTLNTAGGARMRSRQSGCKVRGGDLDRVCLTEKRRGLRLHNPAGTGSAPAAPGLGLLSEGPGTEPPGAERGPLAQGVRHKHPAQRGSQRAALLPALLGGRWRISLPP